MKCPRKGTRLLSWKVWRICTVLSIRFLSLMPWQQPSKNMSPSPARSPNRSRKVSSLKSVEFSRISFARITEAPWSMRFGKYWKTIKSNSTSSSNSSCSTQSSTPTTRKSRSSWNTFKQFTTTLQCCHSFPCWVSTRPAASQTCSTWTASRRRPVRTSSVSSRTCRTCTRSTSRTFSSKCFQPLSRTEWTKATTRRRLRGEGHREGTSLWS